MQCTGAAAALSQPARKGKAQTRPMGRTLSEPQTETPARSKCSTPSASRVGFPALLEAAMRFASKPNPVAHVSKPWRSKPGRCSLITAEAGAGPPPLPFQSMRSLHAAWGYHHTHVRGPLRLRLAVAEPVRWACTSWRSARGAYLTPALAASAGSACGVQSLLALSHQELCMRVCDSTSPCMQHAAARMGERQQQRSGQRNPALQLSTG